MPKSFLLLLIVSMLGCGSVNVQDYKNEKPTLVLENFLNGKLMAYGGVGDRGGKITRRFTCVMIGSWNGNQGIIDETFEWSDGEKQKRVWKLTKTSENKFVGTADDVVGEATGEVSGNTFHWTYTLVVPVKGTNYNIYVDDWMYLISDKVIINKTVMTKFGFKVGELTLSIHKE